MRIALVRPVSPTLGACDLEHLERRAIDAGKAVQQHREYTECLVELGASVVELPAEPELPDAVFVEDTAVVVDEVAVMTVMRSPLRRKESASVAEALARFRPLHRLREPALLEGGDVLRVGKRIFAGLSNRTNREGIAQLASELEPFGYSVQAVEVRGCMHLKTGCCALGEGVLLANADWIDTSVFTDFRILNVPESEPFAANVLAIGRKALLPAGFPSTYRLLTTNGWDVRTIDISELEKAEAGLTCMSILFSG